MVEDPGCAWSPPIEFPIPSGERGGPRQQVPSVFPRARWADGPPRTSWGGAHYRRRRRSARARELILVIDVEPTERSHARRVLERAGFAVVPAEDGVEGVMMARRHQSEADFGRDGRRGPGGGRAIAGRLHRRGRVPRQAHRRSGEVTRVSRTATRVRRTVTQGRRAQTRLRQTATRRLAPTEAAQHTYGRARKPLTTTGSPCA